jgi:hypothetical protein
MVDGTPSRGVVDRIDARATGERSRPGIAHTTAVTVVEEDAATQSIGANIRRHPELPAAAAAVWPPRRAAPAAREEGE